MKNDTAGNYFSSSAGEMGKEKSGGRGMREKKLQGDETRLHRHVLHTNMRARFCASLAVICSKSNSRSMSASINSTEIAN